MEILLVNKRVSFILNKVGAIARKRPSYTSWNSPLLVADRVWLATQTSYSATPINETRAETFFTKASAEAWETSSLFGDIILNIQSQIFRVKSKKFATMNQSEAIEMVFSYKTVVQELSVTLKTAGAKTSDWVDSSVAPQKSGQQKCRGWVHYSP